MSSALNIQNLSKQFNGVSAVENLSLDIRPGEIFGLLGPNGAGKSTTINMVAGVTRIGSGTVSIFGYDNRRDFRTTRRLTGVMHQEIVIDNFFTIDRALRIHAGYYGQSDDPAWRSLLIERLGLGPHLHKQMIKLSGGLKRRFMVAKALIHKPALLILDEPTAGVDVELRHTLWDFVREINRKGTTILLTTHYLEEAEQMCDRIAIMNHGQLVALEPTRDLIARLEHRRLTLQLGHAITTIPPQLASFTPVLDKEGCELTLTLPQGTSSGQALTCAYRCGLEISEIDIQQTSLEDAFLHITGIDEQGRGGRHV